MNVWIVEDELKLAEFIRADLQAEGCVVEMSHSLACMRSFLSTKRFEPDVIVLDRLLQQDDSLTMIDGVHATFPGVKILILSAINTASERTLAINAGADDYMGKPFSHSELVARVKALMRRPSTVQKPAYLKYGNLVIDSQMRAVFVGEKRLNLPNKEFLVLRALLDRPGCVINKNALIEQVWEMTSDLETNVVESTITNLRRKLEEASANIKIRNLRKAGYWIEA